MSGCLSLCPYKMNTNIAHEIHSSIQNPNPTQNTNPNPNPSIRRTLSADMSNQKWLQNTGMPLKRVQSSEQLQALEEVHHDEEQVSDGNKGDGEAAFEDIWSSILSQKKLAGCGSGDVPPPYVHPLVKRSTSSLSEKSLEICTESLGSETGSDGLFSYPPSDPEEEIYVEQARVEEGHDNHVEEIVVNEGDDHVEEMMRGYVEVPKYKYPVNKNKGVVGGGPRCFPPPLPSLAHRDDGSNLHMRTHRQDGRLLLEAVAVPSQNCFRAQRSNGRLLLTLSNEDQHDRDDEIFEDGLDDEVMDDVVEDGSIDEVDADVIDEVMDDGVEDGLVDVEEVAGEVEKIAIMMEDTSSRIIKVHNSSSAMIMSKLMELTSAKNRSTWPRNYNKPVIKSMEDEEEEVVRVEARQKGSNNTNAALPPRPRVSTATDDVTALNAYEYYWRRSESSTAAAVAVLKPLAGKQNGAGSPQSVGKDTNRNNTFLLAHNGNSAVPRGGEVVLVKAAAVGGVAGEKREYLVPMLRGCKEPRRSLLFLEPYCIATT